jgi:hypothetical protein
MLSFSDTLCEVHLDYHTEREAETSLLRFGFDSRPINVYFWWTKGLRDNFLFVYVMYVFQCHATSAQHSYFNHLQMKLNKYSNWQRR